MHLGTTGIWSGQLRGEGAEVAEAAAELEELGFGALWVPGGAGGDIFGACERLLRATGHLVVAPGILNIWAHEPGEVVEGVQQFRVTFPDRFLLGLGVSHAPLVEHIGSTYERPLEAMVEYLDALDSAAPPVAAGERVLAALGPRMLELACERSAGAHPYLVTPDHTRWARGRLGEGPLLAPEAKVVLETDAGRARGIARQHLAIYLRLPNYTNNILRMGFTEDDLAEGGSDRLVDALVAWGDAPAVAARVREHLDAGADHVCVQVLTSDGSALPRAEWRAVAGALLN